MRSIMKRSSAVAAVQALRSFSATTLQCLVVIRWTICQSLSWAKLLVYHILYKSMKTFLVDCTNGRAYATVRCRRLSSVTLFIVAKRCDLYEQKVLLTAYRKSYLRNRLVPKWMALTFRGPSRSCQPLHRIRHWISWKPLEIEAWLQRTTNRKMAYGESNGHVTFKEFVWQTITFLGQNQCPCSEQPFNKKAVLCHRARTAAWFPTRLYRVDNFLSLSFRNARCLCSRCGWL